MCMYICDQVDWQRPASLPPNELSWLRAGINHHEACLETTSLSSHALPTIAAPAWMIAHNMHAAVESPQRNPHSKKHPMPLHPSFPSLRKLRPDAYLEGTLSWIRAHGNVQHCERAGQKT